MAGDVDENGDEIRWVEVFEADERGLVFAFIFDRAGGARRVGWPEIEAWSPNDGLLWLHFDRRAPAVREWLTGPAGLASADADALLQADTRPRYVPQEERMLLVLRGVNLTPGSDPEDMVSLRMGVTKDRMITVRFRPHYTVHVLRRLYEGGTGPKSVGGIVADIVSQMVRNMNSIVEQIDDAVDHVEARMIGEWADGVATDLTEVRQRIVALRRYITPQRTVFQQLHKEAPEWITRADKARLREAANEAERLAEWLDSERERAALLNDEVTNRMAERVGRNVYLLSVLAGLLLVPTLIAGLLGANVAGIPGADTPWAFGAVIGLTVAVLAAELWLLRRLKII